MPETTTTDEPAEVAYHWVMTVQTADGRQGTNDGLVNVAPGVHSCQSTYSEVLRAMKQWMGVDNVTVLLFSLQPNQL